MRILLDIIHADGIIDARETCFFNELKNRFELEEEDHVVVSKKNSLLALTQIKAFDDEQKREFAKMMSEMIVIDEDVNVNEVTIYDVVVDFCNINISFEDTIESERLDNCTKS